MSEVQRQNERQKTISHRQLNNSNNVSDDSLLLNSSIDDLPLLNNSNTSCGDEPLGNPPEPEPQESTTGSLEKIAMGKTHFSGKAMPIVLPVNGKFKLDEDAFEEILRKNDAADLPVVVISIAGSFRKGKSFLLNFFIRYLQAPAGDKSNWLGDPDQKLTGFSWRGGADRDTTGILLWDHVFKVDLPDQGGKVAVLLMDTQGTFDGETSVKECVTIFALSTMTSSVQVYNLAQHIHEDDLQHLELFTEYGKLAGEKCTGPETFKPFQSLLFLVRDWSFPYEHAWGSEGGAELLEKKINSTENKHPQLAQVRKHIRDCFDELSCYLMPHPGLKVSCNPKFNGSVRDLTPEFQDHIRQLAPRLLAPENLTVKRVNGERITCRELVSYFRSYMAVYDEDGLPEPRTVLEATAEASTLITVQRCVDSYANSMNRCMKDGAGGDSYLRPERLLEHHERVEAAVTALFDRTKKLGEPGSLAAHRRQLLAKIADMYANYKVRNETRKLQCNTRTPLVLMVLMMLAYFASGIFSLLWMAPIAEFCGYVSFASLVAICTWAYVQFTGEYHQLNQVLDRITEVIWQTTLMQIQSTGVGKASMTFAASAAATAVGELRKED